MSRGERFRALVIWRNPLRDARNQARRAVGRTERYTRPIRVRNRDAVIVNLHLSGVEVCWNTDGTMPIGQFHLDPVFAERMIRFLRYVGGLGVTRLWTSGFLRAPMSEMDTHPRGQACDITGFEFGGRDPDQSIHLRSGYAVSDSNPRHGEVNGGHSDWFDDSHRLGGRTHRDIMQGIAAAMPSYFDRIVGPGHNPEHMNHFHVEIANYPVRGPALMGIASFTDQPDWVTQRNERQDPDWDAGESDGEDPGARE